LRSICSSRFSMRPSMKISMNQARLLKTALKISKIPL